MKNNKLNILLGSGFYKKSCCIILFIFFSCGQIQAQNKSVNEFQVKAVFLYNFTRFVDWPSNSFTSGDAPFIIGIIGKDPFGTYLEEAISGEKIENHPIIVRHFENTSEINNCQILYINLTDPQKIKEVLTSIESKSILTVNDANNFPRWGGMVRFFEENNKIKLQINASAAKAAQLSISSKLLSVAQIY